MKNNCTVCLTKIMCNKACDDMVYFYFRKSPQYNWVSSLPPCSSDSSRKVIKKFVQEQLENHPDLLKYFEGNNDNKSM